MLTRRGIELTVRCFGWLALCGSLACGNASVDDGASAVPARKARQQSTPEPVRGASNRLPTIRRVAIVPEAPHAGDTVKLETEVSDPDGDAVSLDVAWTLDGEALARGRRALEIPAGSKGRLLAVEVAADDGHGAIARDSASVTVANTAPAVTTMQFDPASDLTVQHDLVAIVAGDDLDGDDPTFSYRWMVNDRDVAAEGAVLDRRRFSRGDRIVLEVRASDGEDESAPSRSAAIEVMNAPPRIHSSPDEIRGEQSLRYRVRAEDPDGDRRLRFRLVQAPKGVELDSLSGELAWTPDEDQAGTHLVEIEVADSAGGRTTQTIELRVGSEAGPASVE